MEVVLRRVGRLVSLLAVAGLLPVRSAVAIEGEPTSPDRWFSRIAALAAIYHSTPPGVLPGATVTLTNNVTVGFDVGYDINKHLSATLALGIPPKPTIMGQGSVTALGALGRVRYGPAIATLSYRARLGNGFEVYAGPGTGYAIILKSTTRRSASSACTTTGVSSSRPESSGASPASGTSTPTSSTSGSTSMRTGCSPVASPSPRA